jgi:LemA protein
VAVLVVALVLVALLLGWLAVVFNGLIRSRTAVDGAWAQIDVQLKRRFDLVPNLTATVAGYASHERQTLDAVTGLRAAAAAAQGPAAQGSAQSALSAGLGSLFAVAERYPDLRASAGFLELQQQLADTEDRIAFARQFYNDAVFAYNRRVRVFPTALVAGVLGFRAREFFQAGDADRAPVPVPVPPR